MATSSADVLQPRRGAEAWSLQEPAGSGGPSTSHNLPRVEQVQRVEKPLRLQEAPVGPGVEPSQEGSPKVAVAVLAREGTAQALGQPGGPEAHPLHGPPLGGVL